MDIEALRRDTPGVAHRVHMNNAGAGLLSRHTLRAMTAHLELEAEIGGYEAADRERDRIDRTYADVAELVGGRPAEIALFDNSTHAWNAAFHSLAFRPGDRILTGRAEYGSNVLAYFQAARRTGAEIVVVPNDASEQLDTAALAELIDERTRLVGVTHVPTGGGLVNPVAEIGRVTRAAGVPFLLDATQSVGQFPVDVRRIGCDMLTATGRKFLRGPRGIGFLWVRPEMLERLDPFVTEIAAATWDGGRGFTWHEGARRFETWERNHAAVLGVTVHDQGERRCAIVTAKVDGVSAAEVASVLARHGVNVSTTSPEHTQFDTEDRGVHPLVRLSPHYYNTEDELDRVVEVIAALPRREGPPRSAGA
jgi:selenocysteine lyase/cysteine desulfurase